ncbi:MAG: DUF4389 domain-containing protein [Leptospirales bacterium]|nr:DUF4389 domain-containing protein [Leptospirales bacterium]
MIVNCTECGAAFAIDDSKVKNKKFAYTCLKCSAKNVFDNRDRPVKEPEKELPASAPDDNFIPADENFDTGGDDALAEPGQEQLSDEFDFLAGIDDGVESPADAETGSELEDFSFDDIEEPFAEAPEAGQEQLSDEFDFLAGIDDGVDSPADAETGSELEDFSFDDIEEPFADASEAGEPDADASPLSLNIESDEFMDGLLDGIPSSHESELSEDASVSEETGMDELPAFDMDEFSIGDEPESEAVPAIDSAEETEDADDNGFPLIDDLPAFDWQNDIDTIDEGVDDFVEDFSAPASKPSILFDDSDEEDENITIDLNSLDINVDESVLPEESQTASTEDENVTLNLDALDIAFEETEELKTGLLPDDDEKLTLGDAGLTLDDFVEDDGGDDFEAEYDERISIEDLGDSIKIDEEIYEAEKILSEDEGDGEYEYEYEDEDDVLEAESSPERPAAMADSRGDLLFSMDYALEYSRPKAVLRLLAPVFLLFMIPHLIVLSIYVVLSLILGSVNNIIALFTGKPVKDFLEIIGQAIRYFIAILASMAGITDEFPVFAGRKDINHSLQMDINYTGKASRFWAALRLSVAGILIASLPHLLACFIMCCLFPVLFLMNSLCVVFTGSLPYALLDIVTRIYRYTARVMAFIAGLTDKYPPFSF